MYIFVCECVFKPDFALNNSQKLVYQTVQPKQAKPW